MLKTEAIKWDINQKYCRMYLKHSIFAMSNFRTWFSGSWFRWNRTSTNVSVSEKRSRKVYLDAVQNQQPDSGWKRSDSQPDWPDEQVQVRKCSPWSELDTPCRNNVERQTRYHNDSGWLQWLCVINSQRVRWSSARPESFLGCLRPRFP